MTPPRASISRTTMPLADPPIDGLHDMRETALKFRVQSKVLHPIEAAA